jgi:SAM-dependent methyltransferase
MSLIDRLYSHLWTVHGDDLAILDQSLGPRSFEYMYAIASELGFGAPGSRVLDAGCGRGNHTVEISRRFGCEVVGFDVVFAPMNAAMRDSQLPRAVRFVQASMSRLPLRDAMFDFVWCRDMLIHLADLDGAMRECSRVLQPGGKMLVYCTVQTDRMEEREAERLYAPLAIVPDNTSRECLESAFAQAGFATVRREDIGSELIEFYEERDGRASRELMRIARMRRRRDELIKQWGEEVYDAVEAVYHWMVYGLIGKLSSGYYVLEKNI